jgi:(p)ppGpp synthase/HD superfamily hydrolase
MSEDSVVTPMKTMSPTTRHYRVFPFRDALMGHHTAVRSNLGASTSYHCDVNPIVASVEDAILIATQAHRGQRYPSPGDEPYIFHPLRVMMEFREPVDQMAAVLHDAVEDTHIKLGDLAEAGFPDDVIVAVDRACPEHC